MNKANIVLFIKIEFYIFSQSGSILSNKLYRKANLKISFICFLTAAGFFIINQKPFCVLEGLLV
jgi:Tfp pilus assembly protein PilZ